MTSSITPEAIAKRLAHIRQTVPESVRIVAVTKTFPATTLRAAYAAGLRDFGESRIQEAASKQAELQDLPDITWHLIGHLQSNKAARAIHQFQWIHSVDSLKLALKLDQLAAELAEKPKVCLQVKILPDPNKYGWTIDELWQDLPTLNECSNLEILGLMSIPPYGLKTSETLQVFNQTRDLAEKIQQQSWSRLSMQQLSMGMSEDYALAVQAGATLIRPGRVLFGDRPSSAP